MRRNAQVKKFYGYGHETRTILGRYSKYVYFPERSGLPDVRYSADGRLYDMTRELVSSPLMF